MEINNRIILFKVFVLDAGFCDYPIKGLSLYLETWKSKWKVHRKEIRLILFNESSLQKFLYASVAILDYMSSDHYPILLQI